MVGGGTLTLAGSIPMVMGANIGTTVTNTIVSLGHIKRGNEFRRAFQAATVHDFFNVLAVIVLFPIEMMFGLIEKTASGLGILLFGTLSTDEVFKSPIKAAIKWGAKKLQLLSFDNEIFYIVISVILTFLMLYCIVKLLRSLVLDKVEAFFDTYIFKTAIRAMVFGMFLTIAVQSSSITTSTIVPLAGAGVLTLRQIYPFTLGANIGTTVTALLASLTLNVTAMVTAFAHLFFNIFGILLVYANPLLRDIPIKLSEIFTDLAMKNKIYPILYLIVVFFLIPFLIILLGGK
jgi:sodium-dependent phosphate cotransporter